MKRTVKREYIDEWLKERYPDAISKLAQASQIPANSIAKIRLGWVPKNPNRRKDLAAVLGVEESELFPVTTGKSRAS